MKGPTTPLHLHHSAAEEQPVPGDDSAEYHTPVVQIFPAPKCQRNTTGCEEALRFLPPVQRGDVFHLEFGFTGSEEDVENGTSSCEFTGARTQAAFTVIDAFALREKYSRGGASHSSEVRGHSQSSLT